MKLRYMFPFQQIRHAWVYLKYGIENLIDYLPLIWKDRDWDYGYLYVMLNKKFERMEKFHRDYGMCVKSPRTAQQLKIVKNLTKRLSEEQYLSNALTSYEIKWGDSGLDEEFEFVPTECGRFFRMKDKRSDKQQKDYSRYSKHSDYMEKQDKEMLFKLIYKYIDTWWD